MAHEDVKDASNGVLKDLKRFQGEKEDDLKRYMVSYRYIISELFEVWLKWTCRLRLLNAT